MENRQIKIKRALVSVSDKENVIPLCHTLHELGVEIISTGGTGKAISQEGIPVTPIEEITGNPEAFGGRMKTISFQIESSILFRRFLEADRADAKSFGIAPIDLIVCNLYPFSKVAKLNSDEDTLVENIDIGGPTMIRAAAKNYEGVCVLTSPSQYKEFSSKLNNNSGEIDFEYRRTLAIEAFRLTAEYDSNIANHLGEKLTQCYKDRFLNLKNGKELRYGENPHQKAWFYQCDQTKVSGIASFKQLGGKELSYNNLLDAEVSWKSAYDFAKSVADSGRFTNPCAVSIIKHLNPCAAAIGDNPLETLKAAWAADPVSSFGSIITFTQTVTPEVAQFFDDKFIEIIIAPKFEDKALDILWKKKNLRILMLPATSNQTDELTFRSISGGVLVQEEDAIIDPELNCVTKATFPNELNDIARFGIMLSKHLRSNAISLVDETNGIIHVVGAGMGQPNRIDSTKKLALTKAREIGHDDLTNTILVSDAFFPFPDNIEIAGAAGIRYIVQPGGSIKDKDVIKACDEHGISMVTTGIRHFRH